ncbi:MAG: BlaI/MecI/CopY family transcriptional regulator [Lachnospiraceae bacterium]|nr:BlaI/MecI/CopY family transcriptional regulator [Lachnospiraceae bacterium]
MGMYQMTAAEMKFAELIWAEAPIGSGELVKRCQQEFGWKKSTTYTFLKKLCAQGIFKNEDAVVDMVIGRDDYLQQRGEEFVKRAYGGSLPRMIAAFMENKRLSRTQIEEIEKMIEDYKEQNNGK